MYRDTLILTKITRIAMKKFFVLIQFLAFVPLGFSQAPTDNNIFVKIEDNGHDGIHFVFSKPQLDYRIAETPNGKFLEITSTSLLNSYKQGEPNLPVASYIFEIPLNAQVSIETINFKEEKIGLNQKFGSYKVIPAQPSTSKSDDRKEKPFYLNEDTYSKNLKLNDEIAIYEEIGKLRSTRLGRIEVRPIRYNPAENTLYVLSDIEVVVSFSGANKELEYKHKEKYSSPYFARSPQVINSAFSSKELINSAPVTYVIISDPMFRVTLEPFIQWKREKGFKVLDYYTDNPEVGTTTSSIKTFLGNLYNNPPEGASPPTFGLLVGDIGQIPSFSGTTGSHKTDLYFFEYTGDKLPEVYYGRFSAQNVEQLQTQIDKTISYEKYQMDDPTYLGNHLLIAGVDGSYAPVYANGHIRYAHNYYSNEINGINPYTYLYNDAEGSTTGIASNYSSAAPDIRDKLSTGVGWANYTAHCSSSGWSNPSVSSLHLSSLTNYGKYGVWIGNCCLSNKFDDTECFGERALRLENRGAVGYIGGSNETFWSEDYYFAVGLGSITSNPDYQSFETGMYDAMFHNKENEQNDPNKWYITQSQAIVAGNLEVQASTSSRKNYYWEIYHLMGDPSLAPYLWEPDVMEVYMPEQVIMVNDSEFQVTASPFACVSLNQNGENVAVAFADQQGVAILTIQEGTLNVGEANIVITAQNMQPYFSTIDVIPTGPYANFYADATEVVKNDEVVFTDASANGEFSTWAWNFGEGASPQTAEGIGPHTVSYSTPGLKTITLTVDNQYERTKTNYINVLDIFTLEVNTTGEGTVSVAGNAYSSIVEIVEGTNVLLEANAAQYWTFEQWTGDLSDSTPSIELSMDGNKVVTANFVEAASATYNIGDISSDNAFTSLPGQSGCPATLTVSIPLEAEITAVDVEYSMTARNQGYKSEQRSHFRCVSEGGTSEETITNGIGNETGTMKYSRKGLTIANGVTGGGNISFELHAGRTWSSTSYPGCSTYNNKVDSATWRVVVHYQMPDKNMPTITAWPTAGDITYGATLGEAALTGGEATYNGNPIEGTFVLAESSLLPNAGIWEADVDFIPVDRENFLSIRGKVSINVLKKTVAIGGTFDVNDKIYDGTAAASISQNNLQLIGTLEADDVSLSPLVEFSDKNAQENKPVSLSIETQLAGNSSANYSLSLESSPVATASITPKLLTINNAVALNKVYDGNSTAIIVGASLVGHIGTDEVTLINSSTGVFEQKNAGENLSVSTSMEVEGNDSGNYILTQPDYLTANIFQLAVNVEGATALDKTYDGTTNAEIEGANLAGIVTGDDATLSGETAGVFAQPWVGANIDVVTSMTIEGADAINYTLEQPQLAASILSKELIITGSFTVADKEYDGNTNATIVENNLSLNGATGNDVISLQDVTANFDTPEAGENKTVTISSAHITGDNSSNYTLSYENSPTTTASIFSPTVYFTLTIDVEGEGDVTVNEQSYTESVTKEEGTELTLVANAAEGWKFDTWSGDTTSEDNPLTLILNADMSVTATFSPVTNVDVSISNNVTIFPNPFTNSITVKNLTGLSSLKIQNIIGQTVFHDKLEKGEQKIIETNHFPKGIYLVTVSNNSSELFVKKLIKN